MAGARLLASHPLEWVAMRCDTCGRQGRYRKATLLARFGGDMPMPSILARLAEGCPNPNSAISRYCTRPYYIDPETGAPWSR